jgi:Zn-dependent metalloprotease
MINSRSGLLKKKTSKRKMRRMLGPALAVALLMTFLVPSTALGVDPAAGASEATEDLKIIRNPATGTVQFLRSKQGLESGANDFVLRNNPTRAARLFFRRHHKLLGMPNADRELVFNRKTKDAIGMTHVRMNQVYRGVPVYGAEVIVHFAPGGRKVRAVNGKFIPYLTLNPKPTVASDSAIAIVRDIQVQGVLWEEPVLTIYSGQIDPAVWGNHLAWLVRIYDKAEPSRNLYVVDAHTGEILTTYDELTDARNRIISDAQNTETNGTIVREEGDPPTGDTDTDDAYDFLGATYNYFFDQHGRDSYNDAGAALRATVHYGVNFRNAFWNGLRMVFGDGFTVDDVTAHELTHAVTQFTANLIYLNESGALNESYSDIFGEFVDLDYALGNDAGDQPYLMGEDLPGIGAIRDMANPPLFGDPDKVSDYRCKDPGDDNGGVHTNSGIPNKAAYLMAEGGSHNGRNVTGIGRVKTGLIQYRALSVYLVASSGLVDNYNALNQSCDDLYGSGSFECQQVDTATLAVEMDTDPACGGGIWGLAYPTLLDTPSDLKLMRQYRDDELTKTDRGRLYARLLYQSSDSALEVLNNNPELRAQAAELISANKGAIADVLAGGEGVIYNTDKIVAFLGAYAQKSPPGLKFLANLVKAGLMNHKRDEKIFLGFRLE